MLSDDDRELLRLAAIACGELHGEWVGNDAYFDGVLSRWNPITDDGDALRLLVMLTAHDMVIVTIGRNGCDLEFDSLVHDISERGDPFAATRRAIVRAAAEIGRKL